MAEGATLSRPAVSGSGESRAKTGLAVTFVIYSAIICVVNLH